MLAVWDNNSTLNVAYGADSCHPVATESEARVTVEWIGERHCKDDRCPRCGRTAVETNRLLALSRRADITICEACGSWEALEDAGLAERMSLLDWAAMRERWWLK